MRRKNSAPPERGVDAQTITVGGLGTAGGDYRTRVRATTHEGVHSPWTADVEFTLTDSTEGTATDPNLPGIPTNLVLVPMLNMILVKFDDEWAGSNPLMSHNAGLYEIQISNATGGSPDWTDASTANEWTQVIGAVTAGDTSTARKKYMVPDGQGFLCAGLKSEKTTPTGGRTHYVRVRGINAHGSVHTTGDGWSAVSSVNLDLENKAQTGTVISDGAIYTEHIGAATIRGTNIFGGTINATEMNANQIYATGIALPSNSSPSHAGDHGEIDGVAGEPYNFNIDINGNMWWGDYDTIGAAITGAQKSYITAAGNATFIGEISTDTDGNARIVIADNTTGGDVTGGDSDGGYAYVLGYTEQASEAIPGHAVWTDESGVAAGYFVAPRYHSGFNYSGLRLKDNNTTFAEALLVSSAGGWAGLVKGTDVGSTAHADVSFVINAADGAYIYNSADAPSSTTNRLYSLSDGSGGANLYWGDDEIGSGSGDLTAITAGITSGLSVSSGTGPIPDLTLSLAKLTNGSADVLATDYVGFADVSAGTTKYCTIQDINDLYTETYQGTVTAVDVIADRGLYLSGASSPTPSIGLSLLTNLDSITPVVGDWVAIHDNSAGVAKRVTIQDILDLGAGDVTGILTSATSGLYTVASGGPIPDIRLDVSRLTPTTVAVADYVAVFDATAGGTRRTTVQDIVDLAPQGTGDVTDVVATANGGLYSGNSSGPVPSLSLSLLSNLNSGTLHWQDWVPFHDNSLGSAKRVIAQDIANLSKTTHLTNGGLWQTGSNGTIQISFGNMNANVTPTSTDLVMFYDSSNSGAVSYCGASVLLNMVGEVSTPVTHDFYLSGSRKVQATGNIYIRSNSGQNYGMTAWTTGQTDLHYGTGVVLKTSTSGVVINGGTLYPSTNGIQSLGASNFWWNYSFHKKMDFSALPSWSGSGYYMWLRNDDTVTVAGSSERIKKNITTIQPTDALARVKALRPVEFSPKSNSSDQLIDDMWEYERFRGFIAEEAAEVSHEYGVYAWWKSDDPESEDYDKRRPSISSLQDEWTDEEVAAYYDLDEATPHMFDVHAILADSVAAIQALEARIAVLEG